MDIESIKIEYSRVTIKGYVYVNELLVGTVTLEDEVFMFEGMDQYPDEECLTKIELFHHVLEHFDP